MKYEGSGISPVFCVWKKYLFKVEKTSTGFSVYAEDDKFPVGTTGEDMIQLKQNILDAMNVHKDYKGLEPISEADISICVI